MKKLSFNLLMDSTILSTNYYPFSGIEVSPIQFLPVVMLQLFKRDGQPTSMIYNVEPYMQGNFTRLTNNWDFVNTNGVGCKLVLAFRFVEDKSYDFSHKFHFWLNLYFDLTYLLNKPTFWPNYFLTKSIFELNLVYLSIRCLPLLLFFYQKYFCRTLRIVVPVFFDSLLFPTYFLYVCRCRSSRLV